MKELDLATITDISELKSIKSDQHDVLEYHQTNANIAMKAIDAVRARIAHLESGENKLEDLPLDASAPAGE